MLIEKKGSITQTVRKKNETRLVLGRGKKKKKKNEEEELNTNKNTISSDVL
jgi:hypothetical protein